MSAPIHDRSTERMLDAATTLFAERGFEVSMAQIARRARVPPQQLRRRFGGKRGLVDAVIARLFASRWKTRWDALLAERSIPLQQRLVRFYTEYRRNTDRTSSRLWNRAGLMGVHASGRFSSKLAERVLVPIARELRREAKLPAPEARPITKAEIELVQMLHGAVAFPNIRRHVYGMDVHGPLGELIAMMVRVWLPGARAEIRRLNTRR
jgi:AcrR family transcriptional regulator